MCCAELTQVPRHQFLSDRINEKSQTLKRSCAQDGLLSRLSKGNLDGSFSSVNGHEHGCCVTGDAILASSNLDLAPARRERRPGMHPLRAALG